MSGLTQLDNSKQGCSIKFKDDPGKKGQLTGKYRTRSDGKVYHVHWDDGSTSWIPEYHFECAEDPGEDVYSLLEKGQFGRPGDLRRNLTSIYLSGRLADMVYSMDTTNTEFYPYQYKPVLTFLESPSNGILIADEVGLGKTIEAGLIWTELRARFNARRLLVVCPAMLREKWRDELRTKFGVHADMLSASELCKELGRKKYEIPEGKGYVCSLQGLRPPANWQSPDNRKESAKLARELDELKKIEPVIDLLVIDEAHYLRNPETQSAKLGELLREVSEHVVLLSATPVNTKERDLYSLLKLVDADSFSDERIFSFVLEANESLHKAREWALDHSKEGTDIKQELQKAADHWLLTGNKQLEGLLQQAFDSTYLAERANRVNLANRIERINLLFHTVNRTRKMEVQELKVVRRPKSAFVNLDKHGVEWDFYQRVTRSIRHYAQQRGISDGFLLASPQRQVSSCMYAAAKSWSEHTRDIWPESLLYEDLGVDDLETLDISPLIEHIVDEVMPYVDISSLRNTDTKYHDFSKIVRDYLKGERDEKIIVFSYFKGTLHYLSERLEEEGVSSLILHGGISEAKQDVIDRFKSSSTLQVLLTSEVASEGVDLQFSRVVINYDLPWNPMKIEQRIGRIDRIGQKADSIEICNLGYADTIDQRIYERLLERLKIFERSLGGMEAILGDKIKELTSDLLSKPLSNEEQEERIEKTSMAIEIIRNHQEELEANAAHLIAHGGYILERVKTAYEFKHQITEHDLELYVKDYLDRYCPRHEFIKLESSEVVKIRLPAKTAALFFDYIIKNHLHGQSRLAGGDVVNCHFKNKVETPNQKNEIISQFHPFIRFISSQLREMGESFYPLIAVKLDHKLLLNLQSLVELKPGTYAILARRWKFSGLKEEEYLRVRAMRIGSDEMLDREQSWELINLARLNGFDWLSAGNEVDVNGVSRAFGECEKRLDEDYKLSKIEHENENADRLAFQLQSAEKHKERLLTNYRRLLERYREEGNKRLIPPTQGKIKSIEQKFDVRIEGFKLKENMTSDHSDVVYGALLLQ